MVDLYRFTKKEYAESFMDGKLYMNSLGFFWKNGFESQSDLFEGTVQMQNPRESPLPTGWASILSSSAIYRLEAYKFCNLFCFYRHAYNPLKKQTQRFDIKMRPFGDYAIRVVDIEEFLHRLTQKAKALGDYYLAGPVNYHFVDEVIETTDCFDKMKDFEWQREWRLVFLHDLQRLQKLAAEDPVREYYEPYVLDIGRLDGIAEIVSANDVFGALQNIYKGYKTVDHVEPMEIPREIKAIGMPMPYQWNADKYVGWGDRPTFQNKVIEIDGGKQRMLFAL